MCACALHPRVQFERMSSLSVSAQQAVETYRSHLPPGSRHIAATDSLSRASSNPFVESQMQPSYFLMVSVEPTQGDMPPRYEVTEMGSHRPTGATTAHVAPTTGFVVEPRFDVSPDVKDIRDVVHLENPAEILERPSVYSWIIPANGLEDIQVDWEEKPQENVPEPKAKGIKRCLKKAKRRFLIGCAQDISDIPSSAVADWDIESDVKDEVLAGPLPTVVYGGCYFDPPEYVGPSDRLTLKLHALEVHQLVDIPETERPAFIRDGININKQAVFDPVALPWDPEHTGMPAAVFGGLDEPPRPRVPPLFQKISAVMNPLRLRTLFESRPRSVSFDDLFEIETESSSM
ncbi:MAG: uncharacterized protein KVP18_004305 [Porospora cf. gigantea A]|uniref:uncharacterized protein n=1 Tax=Porospora cf. gigantea A TaxID=2853593 RepID=UPI003559B0CE|nr:MAG: hypothetical protein KVP18_004305 [Porospora cf. gigantea A]